MPRSDLLPPPEPRNKTDGTGLTMTLTVSQTPITQTPTILMVSKTTSSKRLRTSKENVKKTKTKI